MAKTAATETAQGLAFEEAEPVTKAGRPAGPNPFTDAVARLAEAWDDAEGRSTKGLRCTVASSEANKTRRRITEAAHALEPARSPRISTDDNGTDAVITFSLTKMITRKRETETA